VEKRCVRRESEDYEKAGGCRNMSKHSRTTVYQISLHKPVNSVAKILPKYKDT